MTLDTSFLRSKVARRIFILFILCAMIPISGLSILSYVQVANQLKEQSMNRLYNSVKAHGMSMYERLLFLETNMSIVATALGGKSLSEGLDIEKALGVYGLKRFVSLALLHPSGKITPLYGDLGELPDGLAGGMARKTPGRTLIRYKEQAEGPYNVFMGMTLDENKPNSDSLIGQIETSYLWGIGYENMLPPMTDLCVVDQFRKVLVTSFDMTDNLLHKVVIKKDETTSNFFEYEAGLESYYVSYWPVFLKSGFNAPNVSIVLRRAKEDVLSPLADFKKIFPLIVLLSFWIVAFLSIFHIRKSLTPLEELRKGTIRVAENDFKNKVIVKSDDEFEELAESFNAMSRSLDRHFQALFNRSEIDRAILSSLNVKKIISRALKRMYSFFGTNTIGISIAVDKKPGTFHGYGSTDIRTRKLIEEFYSITEDDAKSLMGRGQKGMLVDLKKESPGYVPQFCIKDMGAALVLPLILNQELKGKVVLGFKKDPELSSEDLTQAWQIAAQITVAISNASLVEELEKLNLGTLEALARTVDAKSAWTAGHSERVTELSVKIAGIMGLEETELETLRRGAYLHDIGKIGIPLTILDKPGRLTNEEYEFVKEHPEIGARILEPIEAYADVLTMIAQHHEKFDGTGYPRGLAGDEISLGGRIMAVADVYDAVVSDRPYRHGWIEEKAVNMIKENAGSHFDPLVVDAFLVAVS